jgi:hypothetical protein
VASGNAIRRAHGTSAFSTTARASTRAASSLAHCMRATQVELRQSTAATVNACRRSLAIFAIVSRIARSVALAHAALRGAAA